MDYKAEIKSFLIYTFASNGIIKFFQDMYYLVIWNYFASDEELFWESHPFESSLEKADDLCEIGYTFQRNEIIYRKVSGKKWFEIGCELKIENYIYKKIGEKAWTIEKIN